MILIAALAVGALAAFAIYSYVGGVEDRADDEGRRVAAVRVVSSIPRGTDGTTAFDSGLFEEVDIPQELVTGREIDRDELEAGLIGDKIAAADLVTGQILVEGMFVDPLTSRVTGADRVPDGNVAITIQVDDVRGVAGLIVPGDYVNMMGLYEDLCGDESTDTGDGDAADGASGGRFPAGGVVDPPTGTPGENLALAVCTPATVVYQEVQVLFVDRSPIPLPGEAAAETVNADGTTTAAATVVDTGLLTLAVPPDAAQLIASIPRDAWYLTLLPTSYTPGPIPDFDPLIELLPGEDPNQLTPYGPEGFQTDTP
ncbi:MAG: hypothetical protein H0W25_18945 [Acidimicrobiia bacterium]|nr:hypothetical protein [Acidimicrobiia bacterium]